jgi:RHS repeat-associated protein
MPPVRPASQGGAPPPWPHVTAMHRSLAFPILAAVLSLGVPTPSHADTSATLATAINLPRGPASIEGLGTGYEVGPADGLPALSFPLEVPPGRAGLVPELALHYHPGAGVDLLGLGWSLRLPAIERSLRHGVPRYDEGDVWTLKNLGDGEELTVVSPGVLRQRIEQGPPVFVAENPDGSMTARTTGGTRYLFGLTADARLARDGDVFRLELSAVVDPHGNRIDFTYAHQGGSDPPLLAHIAWNDGAAALHFDYELRPDPVITRAPGFRSVLGHRLAAIRTEAGGAPVRTTRLRYARTPAVPSSQLVEIATAAADGTALAPLRFEYTAPGDALESFDLADVPALDPTSVGRAWVDVDGDALPDLLEGQPGAWRHRRNLGGEALAPWTELQNAPAAAIGPTARFADLTGDGVQDVLERPGQGDGFVFLGGGSAPYEASAALTLDVSFDLSDPRVALVDLNLDGRIDILRHDEGDAWALLQQWDGPGFHDAEPVPPPPAGLRLGDPGVQLADMDGDRLPDLVRIMQAEQRVLVAASTGFGFFEDAADMSAIPAMTEQDRWELADVNGDGAADLVRVGHDAVALWINQLDGDFASAGAPSWPALDPGEVVILSDVDGSGTVDILRAQTNGSGPWRYWSLARERPGLLESQENGLGYRVTMHYQPAARLAAEDAAAGSPWPSTPPSAAVVLVDTVESDADTWTRTTHYHPRDGWHDPERGELRGFAEHTAVRDGDNYSSTAIVTRRYDLGREDEARGLQLVEEVTADPDAVLVRTVHTVETETPLVGIRIARRTATDAYHVERGPENLAARVRTEWDHDAAGNIVEERAMGRVDPNTGADLPGDERITTTAYAVPTAADGPQSLPAEVVVTDGDGVQVSATRTYYDGEPEQGLPLGHVARRGLVVRAETWTDGENWLLSLRQTHDIHGNVTRIRDAEGGTLERDYDDAGLFPVEERLLADDGALVTRATWDRRHGHPLTVTAPSGATTQAIYDGLGRLVAEVRPGDTAIRPTVRHRYFVDGSTERPAIVTERRRISCEDDVELEVTQLDGLGRLQARVTSDDPGTAAVLAEGRAYDATGTIAETIEGEALPAAALTPGVRVTLPAGTPSAQTWRDALGRVTASRDADGLESLTRYGPLAQDDLGNEDIHPAPPYSVSPERREFDGLGRVVAHVAVLPDRRIVHRYEHDAAGRLRAHIDPEGHASNYTHDGAGRLLRVDSLDAGILLQSYSASGQLTERRDATGARVLWTYDRIGRLLTERTLDPAGALTSEVRYTYDRSQDSAAAYSRGKLTAIQDDAGRLAFDHDARGRIVRMTREFGAHAGPVKLVHGADYDAQDRVLAEHFPGGTELRREYTARGLEAPLAGWITAATYDARGRWTTHEFAGGVRNARVLDHTGRLQSHRVTRRDVDLLHNTHTYDVAGLLADTEAHHAPDQSQHFVYDDLHHLTRAQGLYGVQTWAYADDDNLIHSSGADYSYDGPQPHAVTAARGQTFAYDPAGRLAAVSGAGPVPAGTWQTDPHGRVQSFTTASGERTEHVYDHAGAEAIRREFTASGELKHETLYFSKQVEVRDGRLVRWIWWNDERLAETTTQLPKSDAAPAPIPAAAWAALLMVALALIGAGWRPRRPWPRLVRPARLAGQLALFVLAALSCQSDEGSARPLLPDEHTRYHVPDRLGSAALVLDHHGEPIARDTHDPYGASALAWRAEGERGPDYRFTGAEDTPASGAVVLGARHYLPALGRWSTPDPYYLHNPAAHLDRPGERNLYRYAANNPVQHIDPTGHGWASWLVKGVVRIFKGASKADEVASVVEDAAIIVSRNSSFGARVLSALSLGTEYLPVSVGDIKDGVRWLRSSDNAADAAGSMRLGGYRELRGGTGNQSHHIIQDKAAEGLPRYNRDAAPAVQLQGSTKEIGSQHYKATAIQREAGGGTYAAERRIGYKALRAAGLSAEQSRQAIEFADRYFQGIGVTPSTPTNIPKNRR